MNAETLAEAKRWVKRQHRPTSNAAYLARRKQARILFPLLTRIEL